MILRLVTLSVLGLAMSAGLAQAQQSPDRSACRSDAQTFCSDVQPGGGRLLQCLQAHNDQLSAGCKSFIEAAVARRAGQAGGAGANPASGTR